MKIKLLLASFAALAASCTKDVTENKDTLDHHGVLRTESTKTYFGENTHVKTGELMRSDTVVYNAIHGNDATVQNIVDTYYVGQTADGRDVTISHNFQYDRTEKHDDFYGRFPSNHPTDTFRGLPASVTVTSNLKDYTDMASRGDILDDTKAHFSDNHIEIIGIDGNGDEVRISLPKDGYQPGVVDAIESLNGTEKVIKPFQPKGL